MEFLFINLLGMFWSHWRIPVFDPRETDLRKFRKKSNFWNYWFLARWHCENAWKDGIHVVCEKCISRIPTQNHLVRKRTLSYLAELTSLGQFD